MDWTHAGFLARAIADGLLLEYFHETADEVVGDGFLEKQPLYAEAHLTAIEVTADIGHLHREVEIGVFHHDHRVAATQFKSDPLDFASGDLHNVASHRSRSGKGDAADP